MSCPMFPEVVRLDRNDLEAVQRAEMAITDALKHLSEARALLRSCNIYRVEMRLLIVAAANVAAYREHILQHIQYSAPVNVREKSGLEVILDNARGVHS